MVNPLAAYGMMMAADNPWDKTAMESAKAYIEQSNQAQSSDALQQLLAGNTGSIGALSPDLQKAYLVKKMEADAEQDKIQPYLGLDGNIVMTNRSNAPQGAIPLSAAKEQQQMKQSEALTDMYSKKGQNPTLGWSATQQKKADSITQDAKSAQRFLDIVSPAITSIENRDKNNLTMGAQMDVPILGSALKWVMKATDNADYQNVQRAFDYIQGLAREMAQGTGAISDYEQRLLAMAQGIDWSKEPEQVLASLKRIAKQAQSDIGQSQEWERGLNSGEYADPLSFSNSWQNQHGGEVNVNPPPNVQLGNQSPPPAIGLDSVTKAAKIRQAKEAGYTDEQINEYMKAKGF